MSREELSPAETEFLHDYLNMATLFESIGDVVETDLVHVGEKRIEKNVRISVPTQDIVLSMADKVGLAVDTAVAAVDRDDRELALKVITAKDDVNSIADRISGRLVERLIAEDPHRTSTYRVESQLIENYKRIYYFAKRIAKLVAFVDTVTARDDEEVADAP